MPKVFVLESCIEISKLPYVGPMNAIVRLTPERKQ